jgi:hypothetical protein
VLVEQTPEGRVAGEALVLLGATESGEVLAEGGETVGVLPLPADDRAVELPLGPALAALDAGPPRELLDRAEREKALEAGLTAVATRERTAGPDAGRVDQEGAEEPVDVVGGAGGPGTGRSLLVRGQQAVERRLQGGALLRGQPARDSGTLGPWPRPP